MFPNTIPTLIETFEVILGLPQRIDLHYNRMCRSGHRYGFIPPSRQEVLSAIGDCILKNTLANSPSVRCTIEYRASIIACRAIPYTVRDIYSLLLVEQPDDIDYADKWKDRTCFASLSALCEKGEEPLLIRDGLLTDTTYTNIVIETNGKYLTPSHPLLAGTRRQDYLERGLIRISDISIQDCLRADCIHLINAMMPLGTLVISTQNISTYQQKSDRNLE